MRCKSLKIGLGFEGMVAVLNVTVEMGLFMKIKKKKKGKRKRKECKRERKRTIDQIVQLMKLRST